MGTRRYNPAEQAKILKRVHGMSLSQAAEESGLSQQTISRWRRAAAEAAPEPGRALTGAIEPTQSSPLLELGRLCAAQHKTIDRLIGIIEMYEGAE